MMTDAELRQELDGAECRLLAKLTRQRNAVLRLHTQGGLWYEYSKRRLAVTEHKLGVLRAVRQRLPLPLE